MLRSLRVRILKQVVIHAVLSLIAMLTVALTATRFSQPELMLSIKHLTA